MNGERIRIPEVFKDEEYDARMAETDSYFATHLEKNFYRSYDGKNICYYKCGPSDGEKPAGVVVISHGFTEFAKKYTEFTRYLIDSGFCVYIPEHRGHGESYREVEDVQLTHIDDFVIYVKDLEHFLLNTVFPENPFCKIFLFGHSMGGAVVGRFLETSPFAEKISGCILASPMVSLAPLPLSEKRLFKMTGRFAKESGLKAPFKYSHDFDPDPSFKHAGDTSYKRFLRNLDLRRENDCYKNSRGTNGWILAACKGIQSLFREENKLCTDTLLLIGGKDTVIKKRFLLKFAKKLPNGRAVLIRKAKHSILTSEPSVLSEALELIFTFLEERTVLQ